MVGILPWGACSKVIKKDIVKKSSFTKLKVGEEALFSFNVLYCSSKIKFIDKPLYHYVHNDNGQHSKGGLDPWGPVVAAMKKHLIAINEYSKYEKVVNSFALKSFAISIYRCASKLNYSQAVVKIKENYSLYKKMYDFNNIDRRFINIFAILMFYLIKFKLYIVVIFASKIRSFLK